MKIRGISLSTIAAVIVLLLFVPRVRHDVASAAGTVLGHLNGGTDVNSPGASGNVLESNGSNWTSAALSAGGVSGAVTNPKIRRWSYCAGAPLLASGAVGNCTGDLNSEANTSAEFEAYGINSTIATQVETFGATGASAAGGIVSTHSPWGTRQNLYAAYYGGARNYSVMTRIRLGFGVWTSVADVSAADTQATKDIAAFRYSTVVPDTHFICETSDGTTESTADSGITPAVDTIYLFEIKFNDSTPNIVFSINGSTVCTITTHLPPATTALRRGFSSTQSGTTNPNAFLAWMYAEADH